MFSSDSSLFERLKKEKAAYQGYKPAKPVFFQLFFSKTAARVLTVDKNGVEFSADYRQYQGTTRSALKILDQLQEQGKYNLKWDKQEKGINLSENGFLLWNLKRCPNFVDENLVPIEYTGRLGDLTLLIEGDSQLECKLCFTFEGQCIRDVRFVNENHVYWKGKIFETTAAGVDYSTLISFETLIFSSDLEKYLNLFFSYCENIKVEYKDFQVVRGTPVKSSSSLVFEKIAPDNSLYIRVTNSVPGIDPNFIDAYELTRIVTLDQPRKTILVQDLVLNDIDTVSSKIGKILNDLKREDSAGDAGFYRDDNFFIIEDPLSETFVREMLPQIAREYAVFGSEKLQTYQVKIVKPELNMSIDHGIDFLEGDADLNIDGEVFSLFEALYQFRKNSYVQLNSGCKAILDHEYVEKLERIFQQKDNKVSLSFFDLPLVDELIEGRISGESFENRKKIYQGFLELKSRDMPLPEIAATLRPYQVEGYKWLKYLHDNSLGGCLADDMGLGKTLQAITLLSSLYPSDLLPSLIIIPKSLVFNWLGEISRFNPRLTTALYYGVERDMASARKHHLIITTYGTVRNDIDTLKEEEFHCIILDESQHIKNHESQVSRAVTVLKARIRFALSGTPIENSLGELYSLFRFLNPGMFGSLAKFNRQYLFAIQQTGNKKIASELKKKIYPFILRRLKKDVLHDLPEKVEQILYVEMSSDQKKFYEQRRTFFYETIRNQVLSEGIKQSQFFVLQAITVLRQIASIPEVKSDGQILSPKRELLMENMAEAIANDHKILLFANFLGILEYIAKDLTQQGIDFETLTGATRNREIPVQRFQSDPNCKVFLLTLKTGGQGLNLTAADTVYIFDPWWNLAAENQATDRSHRIGQDKTVFTYKLIAKGTIEEKILSLQQKKKALFENIISDESMSYKFLDEDDIDYLMG
ncbi:DEAD/DEAH box helicase [bacterium]|nr:DEAD/DEAH box helicase [bacterium]